MAPRPDLNSLSGLNPESQHCAQRGERHLIVRKLYGRDQLRYWRGHNGGLEPQTKWLISLVPGKRTAETIQPAVADAASRLAAEAPPAAIFTPGEPAEPAAILEVFGPRYRAPRRSHLGGPPAPLLRVPHD